MQFVGQTCRKLKNRFGEHYRKIKKPKKIDTFLYQHFKRTGHSPDNVLVQPVEKLIYDENSSVRFNTIKRFESELKWIKLLQSASPLGFNENLYQEGNISKMPDFDVFSLLEIRKRKRILDIEANRFFDRNHQMYEAALLTRCYTQHALRPFIDAEINHQRHFIKIPFINKEMDFIDLPSIFQDKSVSSSIPDYFQNSEPPIICYKYNKPIRHTIFNFNKLVSDLDIHANTPSS